MKVNRSASFTYFLYPFTFDTSEFDDRSATIDASVTQGAKRELATWMSAEFLSDGLLAHIAHNLDRETCEKVAARCWRLNPDVERVFGLGRGWHWTIAFPKGEVPFSFTGGKRFSVELILFRVGVGFLVFYAAPLTEEWNDWCDFIHYFRFTDRGHVRIKATGVWRQSEPGTQALEGPSWPEVAGGLEEHPDGEGALGEIKSALLSTASLLNGGGSWWRDVFVPGQLIPYACLYIDETGDLDRRETLYRARNFFHSKMEIRPAPADLSLDGNALLQYAQDEWFTFSLEGGTFVAFDCPRTPFFLETMPDHVGHQYFTLFLIALHQRFVLITLSCEVAETWVDSEDCGAPGALDARTTAFTTVLDRLLSFNARGYFKQVMQSDHHHRCYLKWQDTLQTDLLFDEVTWEVNQMHDYLEARASEQRALIEKEDRMKAEKAEERSKRLEKMLNLFAWIIGVPILAASSLGATGGVSKLTVFYWVLASVLLGALLYLFFTQLVGHSQAEKGRQDEANAVDTDQVSEIPEARSPDARVTNEKHANRKR